MNFLSKLAITLIFINFFSNSFSQGAKKAVSTPVKSVKAVSILLNSKDSLSYAIGLNIAENLEKQKMMLNPDILAKAFKDLYAKKGTLIKAEDCQNYIQTAFQKETAKVGLENKKKGLEFLAKNKSLTGVVTTASGLQYKILKEGNGAKPLATDKVKVHYHGTLINGTVFDSSVNRNEPATFGVNQVIPGWVEALQLMPVGSKWTLYIPSNLAYGQQGPPNIGPDQVLLFDVELLEIVK